MEKEFDELLRRALSPKDEPDFWLNQNILNRTKEQKTMIKSKKKVSVAVLIAALVLCLSSVTVYAAWKYLSASDVTQSMEDLKLADAFTSGQAVTINETQCYGGYQITLLSIISGENLSEFPSFSNDSILSDRTYVVVAIENADGTPMPDTSEDAYANLNFFASPLIAGYNPVLYNIASMNGNHTTMTEDGVLYRLLECDNVEIFADQELYLCVSDGVFYNGEAYIYDEISGKISRNESYNGLNALFQLPLDAAKANPQKATDYIESLGYETEISREERDAECKAPVDVKVADGNKDIVTYALQFLGNPYVWGSNSLTEGADSSGFTKSVYANFGIELPHDSIKQREFGNNVEDLEDIHAGDLVFYDTPAHVAIYIGDGLVVHAMPEEGICVSKVDFDEILCIRRLLNIE